MAVVDRASTMEVRTRTLDSGERIDFESAPFGSINDDGQVRLRDHRAYYWTPTPTCVACDGTGRAPSEKRPGGTVKCKPCDGTGETKRRRMVATSSVLDAICPMGGLPMWYEARGIEGAVQAVHMGEITKDDPPDRQVEIVRTLKLGAERAKVAAADRGLNVHALLEDYMITGSAPSLAGHPVEHHGYITALTRWLLKANPEPVAVEHLVCSPEDGYAGRLDLRAMVDGFLCTYDAKTQEKGMVFRKAHTQVAMYERAAIRCGDTPADLLKVVVFAANGDFREMAANHGPSLVDAALAWYRESKPIDSVCESANRIEREARK